MSKSAFCSGSPDYILLNSNGYIDDFPVNDTTAGTATKSRPVQVTFVINEPPRLSRFYVYSPTVHSAPTVPEIAWSSENLALLRIYLAASGPAEYFIYRAGGPGYKASLDLLPDTGSYMYRQNMDPNLIGLLPDGDGKHFVVAAFGWDWEPKTYTDRLHVFRSKHGAWTQQPLVPDIPSGLTERQADVTPDKVINVGDGVIGYVDLWRGMLLCNVLDDPVTSRFVPLPALLPNNRECYHEMLARSFRDVACTDGTVITCVELEHLFKLRGSVPDVSGRDMLCDFELAKDPREEEQEEYESAGWRLIPWYRHIYWRKGSMLHVDDELGTVSLPGCGGVADLPLKDLKTTYPVVCAADVVCLMSRKEVLDQTAWVVTVDMGSKSVGELVPYDANRSLDYCPNYISCALHKYLMNGNSDEVEDGARNAHCAGSATREPPPPNSNHHSKNPPQKRQRLLQPNQRLWPEDPQ